MKDNPHMFIVIAIALTNLHIYKTRSQEPPTHPVIVTEEPVKAVPVDEPIEINIEQDLRSNVPEWTPNEHPGKKIEYPSKEYLGFKEAGQGAAAPKQDNSSGYI